MNVWSGSDYSNSSQGFIANNLSVINPSTEWSVNGNQSIKLTNDSIDGGVFCRINDTNVSEGDDVSFKVHVLNRNNHKIYAQIIQINSVGAQTQLLVEIPHSESEQIITVSKNIDQAIDGIYCQVSGVTINDIVFIDELSLTKG